MLSKGAFQKEGTRYTASLMKAVPTLLHGFGCRGIELKIHLQGMHGVILPQTQQVHGNMVHVLERSADHGVLEGDAFVTNVSGMVCAVRTADCVPILIADPVHQAVGAVHAGWRGTARNVVGRTVQVMRQAFGSHPAQLLVAIGPCICARCYEVGLEVVEALAPFAPSAILRKEKRVFADLAAVNQIQLCDEGVKGVNIVCFGQCTSCSDGQTFASFRRDRTAERQVHFIVLSTAGEG